MPSVHGAARVIEDFLRFHMPENHFFLGLASVMDDDFEYMEEGLPNAICSKDGYLKLIKAFKVACPDFLIAPSRKVGPESVSFDIQLHGSDFVTVVDVSGTFGRDSTLEILDLPPIKGLGVPTGLKSQVMKIYVDVESNKVERLVFKEGHGFLSFYEQLGGDIPNYPIVSAEKGDSWSFNPCLPPGGTASFAKEERPAAYRHTTAKNVFSMARAKSKPHVPRWARENEEQEHKIKALKVAEERAEDERVIFEAKERGRLEALFREKQKVKVDEILGVLKKATINKDIEGIEAQIVKAMKLKPIYAGPEIDEARRNVLKFREEARKAKQAEVRGRWKKAGVMLEPLNAFLQQRTFTSWLTEFMVKNEEDSPNNGMVKLAKIVLSNEFFPKRGPMSVYVSFMKENKAPKEAIAALKKAFNIFAPFKMWIADHSNSYAELISQLDAAQGDDATTIDEFAKTLPKGTSKGVRQSLAQAQVAYMETDHADKEDEPSDKDLEEIKAEEHNE